MTKKRVLFVCVHNSARSQMAEAFLNSLGADQFEAKSAGLEPGQINPLAVQAMAEAGFDISRNPTKSVFDIFRRGELFSFVITVCDTEAAEKCPIFPGITTTLNWSFEDPASFQGTWEERLEKARRVRDAIRTRVEEFVIEYGSRDRELLDFSLDRKKD